MTSVQQIVQAAQEQHGWKAEEVRIDEVERLRRGDCAVFTAASNARMSSFQASYALLKGALVTGPKIAATLLSGCGDAPADWQAEIIARFVPGVGGQVLTASSNPGALRRIKSTGKTFSEPSVSGNVVTFYVLEPEAFIISKVVATRDAGDVKVQVTEL